jgi:hypothetical protein
MRPGLDMSWPRIVSGRHDLAVDGKSQVPDYHPRDGERPNLPPTHFSSMVCSERPPSAFWKPSL